MNLTPQASDVTAAARERDDSSLPELYEQAPCGYLSTTLQGIIVRANHTFSRWTGYPAGSCHGRSFNSLLDVGSQLFYETRCLPLLQLQGEVREVALALKCFDGRTLPILANFVLAHSADGHPALIRTAVFDATERQDYERDLLAARRAAERSEVRVRVLQEAAAGFGHAEDEDALTTALIHRAGAALDAATASVRLVDEATGRLRAADGTLPDDADARMDEHGPELAALRTRSVVTISSLDEADRTFPQATDRLYAARVAALTVTPLLLGDAALGVLVCCFGRTREFDEHDVQLQTSLAQQATSALQRIRLQQQLQIAARHDRLTGLANRDQLHHRLRESLPAGPAAQTMSLIFIDLDGFKAINDEAGHLVGDAALLQVAERLRASVRSTDLVARFGGDEFVVLCPGSDVDSALALAERIRAAVREPLVDTAARFALSASIGVVVDRSGGQSSRTAEDILKEADAAMYRSKAAGKNRVTLVSVGFDQTIARTPSSDHPSAPGSPTRGRS